MSLTDGAKNLYIYRLRGIFRVTLSLQIYCLKSVGAKAAMGNPPMGLSDAQSSSY